MDKKQKIIIIFEIITISIVSFFIGSDYLTSPFYGSLNFLDEGQFVSWANSMLHGKLMFRDLYIVYGPLFIYPLYVLFRLFSPSVFMFRLYYVISGIGGILVLNIIMLDVGFKRFIRYLANLFILLIPGLYFRQAVGWFVLYALLKSEDSQSKHWFFITGVFIALSVLVSPEIGIIVGFLIGIYYAYKIITANKISPIFNTLCILISGFLLLVLLFTVWSYKEGWFYSYINTTKSVLTDFNGENVPNGKNFLINILHELPKHNAIAWIKFIVSKDLLAYWVIIFYIATFIYFLNKIIIRNISLIDKKMFLYSLYGLSTLYLLVSRPDHFFFIFSPVILIGIYFIDKLIIAIKQQSNTPSRVKVTLLSLLLLLLFFYVRVIYINYPSIRNFIYLPHAIISVKHNPAFVGAIQIPSKQSALISNLQAFTWQHSTPMQQIFIFSNDPMLYLLLNRENATSYVLPYAENTLPLRISLLSELMKNKPVYIFKDKNDWPVDGISNDRRLPEIKKYIQQNYFIAKTIENYIIFQRKQ